MHHFGFTEPYLFDRPIATGFTIFYSQVRLQHGAAGGILLVGQPVAIDPALQENYNTDSRGFTIFASYPVRRFSFARIGLSYGWSTTNITPFSQSATLLFEFTKFTSLAGPSALNGIRQSQITPTLTYNSTDSPLFPTRGKNITYGASFAGGPLGGNVNTISNIFDMSYFHPVYHHRNVLAIHFKTSMISGYGGKEVPPNNRFYAGGENDVRGFDFYTISPFVFIPFSTTTTITYVDPRRLNAQGQPTAVSLPVNVLEFIPTRPGGDLEAVSNIEYRIPLVKSYVTMNLFHDLAVNGILRRSQLQLDPSAIASLQQQYPNADFPCLPNTPCLQVPHNLQIAHGTNFWPHTSAGIELDFQIPIIQAPFRIFYAYNYSRFSTSIEPPLGAFFVPPAERNSLQQLGVYNTQIVPDLHSFLNLTRSSQTVPPSLFEQKTTLRFAVSRTF